MWIFSAPQIVFGEDALSYLEQLEGRRALIVTDPVLNELGFVDRVIPHLRRAGIRVDLFAEVEPEPSLQTVQKGAKYAASVSPDWIIGLGGGSSMDAAKAIAILYEYPELDPAGISPVVPLQRHRVKLLAIPTTSGTGSEATWALVLTDSTARQKLSLASRELVPDIAVVDPALAAELPPSLTADTGLDVLTHGIEGYTATWHNDFTDGLCLQATRLVFEYLPRAYTHGGTDRVAREHMANAAAIAGLGFGNSNVALAHAMGHSFGGRFKRPHGRIVAVLLPYTMQYTLNAGYARYGEMARALGISDADDDTEAGQALIAAVRRLQHSLDQPSAFAEMEIPRAEFVASLEELCDHTESDPLLICCPRIPEREDLERLFRYAFEGSDVDF